MQHTDVNVHDILTERIGRILGELDDRLEGEYSDNDDLALRAAVSKAAVQGFLVGAGETAWICHLQGVNVDVNYLNDLDFDLYAQAQHDEA